MILTLNVQTNNRKLNSHLRIMITINNDEMFADFISALVCTPTCANGGTCTVAGSPGTCTCAAGYGGSDCNTGKGSLH